MNKKLMIGMLTGALVVGGLIGSASIQSSFADDDNRATKTPVVTNIKDGGNIARSEASAQVANAPIAEVKKEAAVFTSANEPGKKTATKEDKAAAPAHKTMLTKAQAAEIAVKKYGGKVTEIERDREDGKLIYEIEVRTSKGEVELDMDAYTGAILEVDYDDDDDDDDDDHDDYN